MAAAAAAAISFLNLHPHMTGSTMTIDALGTRRPVIMGILNVTPDSFSDGGLYHRHEDAVRHALRMIDEGAHIIDIGGESSRPGAERVPESEEIDRVIPVIESVARERPPAILSIDTQRARVAERAIEAGCRIVNDISACRDPEMPGIIGQSGVLVIVMHMLGEPRTMQVEPHYDDVVAEVRAFLLERVDFLRRQGVDGDRIVIDPGIGFGKRFQDNLELLQNIEAFRDAPVLVGASRKRFLGELLDSPADDRLPGSLAVAAWCHRQRVDIVRVHDVRETARLFRVLDAIERPGHFKADG